MVDQLNLQIEQAKSLVEAYRAKALAAQKEWLTAGGGQKQLNTAAGNKKELKKVRVPIADFQKAGMEVALEELHERVDGCGPPISTVLMFTLTLAACFSPRASWEGAVAERINEIRDMDPRQLANKVFDSETMDILGGRIEQTQALVKTYQARAEEAKAAWLQSGGQAQLDAASPRGLGLGRTLPRLRRPHRLPGRVQRRRGLRRLYLRGLAERPRLAVAVGLTCALDSDCTSGGTTCARRCPVGEGC